MKKQDNKIREAEYQQQTGDYASGRNRHLDWLVFIFCVLAAFVIWLIALNASDPIIEKDVSLIYELQQNDGDYELNPEYNTVRVYGTKSVLDNVNEIKVVLTIDDFGQADSLVKSITYPNGVKPVNAENKTVDIKLVSPD